MGHWTIQFGELDIRVHKNSQNSPATFDVVIGNRRTGDGVLMFTLEQEQVDYPFYRLANIDAFVEGTHSIDSLNILLQLLKSNPESQETNSS